MIIIKTLSKFSAWCDCCSDSTTMLGQRWHRVKRLAYVRVGSTTLAQNCPYVSILSFAVGSIPCWNQYLGPTFGQCTPFTCFNITELRWVHYFGPTVDQRMPATLGWITVCWTYYVDPTLGQCTPVTCFNMTELRWLHYVWPTLDQRMPATLVLDNSLLKILRWPNVGQMHIGDVFKHAWIALVALRWVNIGPTYAYHFGFWITVCWKYYVDPMFGQ